MTSVVRSVVTCQADADVSLPLTLLSRFLSLPPSVLHLSPLLLFHRLTISVATPPMQPANAIRSALFLPLPHPSSRNVPSRFNLRDRPPPPSRPSPFPLPSSPFPSQGFSPFFRTHPRSFPPPHCASFHPQPSLVLSRSFQRLCQWRDLGPFFAVNLRFLGRVTSHSTSVAPRHLASSFTR